MPEQKEGAVDAQTKGLKDINIYSRKFLLTVFICAVCIYGIRAGTLKWEFAVSTMMWVVIVYNGAEGYADSGNGSGGQLGKILGAVVGATGAASGLKIPPELAKLLAGKVPDPKPPKEDDEEEE
jgi:hypothetical protein